MTIEWRVLVALESGPVATEPDAPVPEPTVWSDLSERVRSLTYKRGREDRSGQFDPGSAVIEFDNSDQMLDPTKTGSLVEAAAGKGLPLAPLMIYGRESGDEEWQPLFYGLLGPECWIVQRSRFADSTSSVQAFERSAWWAQVALPSSPFAAYLKSRYPAWWIRSLGGPISGNGGLLQDESGYGSLSFIEAAGSAAFFSAPSLVGGDDNSAIRVPANAAGVTADSGLTAATDQVSAVCVWKGTPSASDQRIMRQRRTGGAMRWQVFCTPGGQIAAAVYNTSGVLTNFVVAPANPDGGRWDDDEPHLICFGATGGSNMRIWVDSRTALQSGSIPSTFDGRIIFGNGGRTYDIDEVAYWRRRISLDEMNALGGAFTGATPPFAGQTMAQRWEEWVNLTGFEWTGHGVETLPPTVDPGLAGVSEVPESLADALAQIAESYGGAGYILRDGALRIRRACDFTDPDIEDLFGEPLVNLTDQPSPSSDPLPVRRSQPEWSGVRLDRIVNVSSVDVGGLRFDLRDDDSVARYGERRREWTSDLADPLAAIGIARTDASSNSVPVAELRQVVIDPSTDANATEYLLEHLELETLANLTWTPHGGSAQELLCQVQGYEVTADAERVTVALSLAPLRDPVVLPEPEPEPEPETEELLFEFAGEAQTFTVPDDVFEVTVTAAGASGGSVWGTPEGLGGLGAVVQCTIDVTPGEDLEVYVGGAGAAGTGEQDGGWNGGGASGGQSTNTAQSAGGGGASDVRQGGTVLADRVVVAGGGGGAGGAGADTVVGVAGGDGGETGGDGGDSAIGLGGDGGSASAGGSAGTNAAIPAAGGFAGALGVGGAGGGTSNSGSDPGGGGGGGLYGGGGGAGATDAQNRGGAGGGGSSLVTGTATSITAGSAPRGNGFVLIEWETP